jgi:hypothetical protein
MGVAAPRRRPVRTVYRVEGRARFLEMNMIVINEGE